MTTKGPDTKIRKKSRFYCHGISQEKQRFGQFSVSQAVDFESFFDRFRVDFESFSSRNSKSTQNRLENDRKTTQNRLPGRGVGGGGE